jgi:cadmium resistance protein CadD (predicted permease)
MESLIALLGLTVVVFASTNIDDVFLLLSFFADPKFRARDVVIGQYIGIGVLYSTSLGASFVSLVIPSAYLGLLGLVPVAIGLKRLIDLRRDKEGKEGKINSRLAERAPARILSVSVVTMANGGDNIGIYTPLFATHSRWQIGVMGLVFAVMTALWCLIGHWMVNHPLIGAPIRRYGHRAVPFVLIGLGTMILYEAGTFKLLRV